MASDTPPPSPHAPARRARPSWGALVLLIALVWGASQAWSWWRNERAVQTLLTHARAGDITLYTTTSCPYCTVARAWLDNHGVPWTECNVDTSAACLATYQAKGSPGVPLVQARTAWRLGFNPDWLSQTLSASQGPAR